MRTYSKILGIVCVCCLSMMASCTPEDSTIYESPVIDMSSGTHDEQADDEPQPNT